MADNDDPPPPNPLPPPAGWPPPSPVWPPPPGGYYAPPPPQVPPVNATLILIFGILSIPLTWLCGIGVVFGVVAWIMGNSALQTLDQIGDPMSQRGTVNAGRICGIIGTVMFLLGALSYGAFIAYALIAPHP